MIQRVQSLFLLAVVALSVILFFVPYSEKNLLNAETGSQMVAELSLSKGIKANGESASMMFYGLLLLNLLVLADAFYTIFLYKNRAAQMRLCILAGILATLELILIFYLSDSLEGTGQPKYLAGTYLVALQAVLLMMARRFIRRDEQLVRSADRIR